MGDADSERDREHDHQQRNQDDTEPEQPGLHAQDPGAVQHQRRRYRITQPTLAFRRALGREQLPDRVGGEPEIDDAPDREGGTRRGDQRGIRTERSPGRLGDGSSAGLLWLSVVLIALLVIVLAIAFRACIAHRPSSGVEAIVVDGVVGLYLGWVSIATAANTAAWLTDLGFDGWGIDPNVWGVIVVAVAGLVGVGLAVGGRGRLSPAASLGWGLSWVAVGRLAGDPYSVPVGVTAIVAVVVVVLVTVVIRVRAAR